MASAVTSTRSAVKEGQVPLSNAGSPAPVAEASAADDRRVLARLDAIRAKEDRDLTWAPVTEKAIAAIFTSSQIVGTQLKALECRATLCRMDAEHRSKLAADSFGDVFPALIPDFGSAYVARSGDPQSGYKTTYYLARLGSHVINSAVQN